VVVVVVVSADVLAVMAKKKPVVKIPILAVNK